jgi:hypothetical protein
MASTSVYNKAQWVAMNGLALLTEKKSAGRFFNDEYSGEYAQKYAIGSSMDVPLSQRYIGQRNNMTYNPEAFDRPKTTITMAETYTGALEWEDIEKTLDMERGEDRVERLYVKPMIEYAWQAMESDLLQFAARNASMLEGTLGVNPSSYDSTSAAALQRLGQMGVPVDSDELGLVLPFAVNRAVKTANQGNFNPTVDISRMTRTGMVQKNDSFEWVPSNSLYYHTAGTWAGAITVKGANQSGSFLTVNCTTGDIFNPGDKLAAGVNETNLMTRAANQTSTIGTKTFTVTGDDPIVATASQAVLPIYPPIYAPGSHYQNVDALPSDGATVTMWPGTASPSGKKGRLALALYPGAFFFVSKKLEEPKGSVEWAVSRQDPNTGAALRIIRQWSNSLGKMTTRCDILWGRGVGLAEQCAVVIACA